MKIKIFLFRLGLCLLLMSVLSLGLVLNFIFSKKVSLKERELSMVALLKKDKAYDKKEKSFQLQLTVKVDSADLFKFNDNEESLKMMFYKSVVDNKGSLGSREIKRLRSDMAKHLRRENIHFKKLDLRILSQ